MKRIAIVGATGLVGREIIHLCESYFDKDTEYILYASEKSEGSKAKVNNTELTVKLLSKENIEVDFDLITNRVNRGKGYSIKKGFKYALDREYTHAVTLDADLQHDPKYINDFIKINDDVDIVIGARSFDGDMPFLRRFSNSITSFIVSKLIGKRVYDSQSGYRRYRLNSIPFDQCLENGFQFESEILINTLRQKHSTLDHVTISTLYNDEKSSINNALDTYKFIKLIVRKIIAR